MTTNEFIHRKDLGYQYIIDLASSNASYYYPVVFSPEPPLYAAETLKFHVIRPSVNQDGSSYGSMDLDVEIQRAVWGNTDYQYTYRFFEKSGPLSRWFGVVNHGYHGVVYLRGGRTYYLYSSAPVENISNLGATYTVRSGEPDYEITFGIQTNVDNQPPTSTPSGGTESVNWVNAVPNKSLESSSNIKVPGITLTSGAGANKILSSDASGNASWGYTAVGSVGSPGSSTNLVTEAGIRSAINTHISADNHTQYLNTTRHDTTSRHTPGSVVPVDTTLNFPGSSTAIPSESAVAAAIRTNYINFLISGGGDVIQTGMQGAVQVPWACTLTEVRLISVDGTSGSITVAVKKSTYSDHPTLTDIASYSISSSTKASSSISVSLSAGDYLYFNVSSVSAIKLLLITFTAQRS